ncbi:Uma2 family endonuclease [Dolichospermum circinale]|uniref:Uma2 family endonuclease n=1 Tax=Dolichospermum circinale TaxID=109265 RepID=UPI00232E8554|nr:Uma2 family endonuclease [Dolichospermum circinale]MDB9455245.1 Uma2 family endonuclease [Dolichospermum circinale CS-541/06]MDB9461140.1 Uma2 family endonuclease [Dolichospermum circinale CS-541/04]MDB9548408.1 Uma2 family endonuclease [Dolichospermum circinale CS-1031]
MNTQLSVDLEILPMVLEILPNMIMTDDQFFDFCQLNRHFRIERNQIGDLFIMSPTDSETGQRNFNLIGELGIWTKQDGTGVGFGSSGGFTLPNGAVRSPDAAWIKRTKWEIIPADKRKKFAPICPEFVVELRSENDSLSTLKEKMQEYIDNGTQLAWLIDRKQRKVFIYRPNCGVAELDNPQTLTGEDILPGFVLDLSEIW